MNNRFRAAGQTRSPEVPSGGFGGITTGRKQLKRESVYFPPYVTRARLDYGFHQRFYFQSSTNGHLFSPFFDESFPLSN